MVRRTITAPASACRNLLPQAVATEPLLKAARGLVDRCASPLSRIAPITGGDDADRQVHTRGGSEQGPAARHPRITAWPRVCSEDVLLCDIVEGRPPTSNRRDTEDTCLCTIEDCSRATGNNSAATGVSDAS